MDEKHLHYFKRTVEHIHRVQRNALRLVYVDRHRRTLELSNEECRQLIHGVMAHDRSKFSVEQFAGYVELTDYFATRRLNPKHEYPPGARELADAAWHNHFMVENHHPERQDVEIEQWSKLQAIECACDLQAMAQEFREGSCRKFWEEVWKPKHRGRFYDDFNYWSTLAWMDSAIRCFEADLGESKEGAGS